MLEIDSAASIGGQGKYTKYCTLAPFGIRLRTVVQETGYAPPPFWTGAEDLAPIGNRPKYYRRRGGRRKLWMMVAVYYFAVPHNVIIKDYREGPQNAVTCFTWRRKHSRLPKLSTTTKDERKSPMRNHFSLS